ncbi:hypothetical protein N5P37_008791 [Trichoderma harzianum]|uniref:Uncharacterized protein n=1 Tax=Trichoderma harzianum CBS 226.95 TaxID=983964 RepID=A0A2T4A704_TRIHA|nr:hypothetical protein M431DRAFT_483964 [Trichoderma harzianum CBS 226.95]KAK0758393.1 hypothetical protein N5P37_008791 [Trichoderma harzianum]PTB52859.1 hypothetical protein M431DRAFT_483964 [Trichoderma harzianum CBS 226.95]
MGQGRVNLITGIGAVVLLGNNFGENIRPSNIEAICDRWSQMLKDRSYLGACISDLTNIMRSHGEEGVLSVQELQKSKDFGGIPRAGSRTLKPRESKPPVASEASYGVNAFVSHQIQLLGGGSNSLSLTSGHLSPGVESATTEQCDSYPGLHESQTGASIDGSLATSSSSDQGGFVSGSQTPSRIFGEELLGGHPSSSQEAKVLTSQENGNADTQQKTGRLGKREFFKQQFSQAA